MKPKDLRDEFALAALPEVIRDSLADISNGRKPFVGDQLVTVDVYIDHVTGAIADAMMAERERKA